MEKECILIGLAVLTLFIRKRKKTQTTATTVQGHHPATDKNAFLTINNTAKKCNLLCKI